MFRLTQEAVRLYEQIPEKVRAMSNRKIEMLSARTMSHGSMKGLLVASTLGAASILAIATGCSRDNVAHAATTTAAQETPSVETTGGPIQEDSSAYAITTATVGDCKAGADCTATITITAKGEYHVNETYPFKFTAAAAPPAAVEFHGASGNVFTGADFARQGKTAGVMTVKFKPAAKGKVAITGTYKICICTDKICQPSTTQVTIDVDVK